LVRAPLKDRAAEPAAAYCAAVTLSFSAVLAVFLLANGYPLLRVEVGVLVVSSALAGVALAIVASGLGRTIAAPLLGMIVAFCADLLFGLHEAKALLAIVPVLCGGIAWMLRDRVATVIGVASGVLLASALVMAAFAAPDGAGTPEPPLAEVQEPARQRALPVVLHLILDEHIGIDGIPREVDTDGAWARQVTDFYVDRGFQIYRDAYSEYVDTRISISELLNFSSDSDEHAHLLAGDGEPYVLKDGAYFKRLAARGYRLNVYQSDYMDFCHVPGIRYSSCTTYSAHRIGALDRTPLDALTRARFIANSLLEGSAYLRKFRQSYENARRSYPGLALRPWAIPVSRLGPIPVLGVIDRLEADLRKARRGELFFAHLLIPHYPYVLDPLCSIRQDLNDWLYNSTSVTLDRHVSNTPGGRITRYRRYFAQILCQQRLLDRLFDAMKKGGTWDDAVIIVHGDHGSRIVVNDPVAENAAHLTPADLRDAFSTLFAWRSPGQRAGVLSGARSLQGLLGDVLGVTTPRSSPRKVYLRSESGQLVHYPLEASLLTARGGRTPEVLPMRRP
jgi:hypothetical protein